MSSARISAYFGFFSLFLFFFFLLFSFYSRQVYSIAGHVVISEIQVGGDTASDEFIELYNPTNSPVDLSGWRLRRTGTSAGNLVASMSGSIPARGFFLVAHPSYTGSISADLLYSATSSAITGNSTVTLYSDAGVTIVDKVGMGSSADGEGTSVASPSAQNSIERKASVSSTTGTMNIGGADELQGNGEDTDNNTQDFVSRVIPQPQNTSSPLEPANIPTSTPTITQTPTPSHTPSPTISLTPSASPSVTISPTTTPSLSPTATPTGLPSSTPTSTSSPTPTVTSSPTVTPTISLTMTLSPTTSPSSTPTLTMTPPASTSTPTMTPGQPSVTPTVTPPPQSPRHISVVCSVTYRTIHTRWVTVTVPKIRCSVERT